MYFASLGVLVTEVVLHVFGQQMAAIAGGVNQYIGRGGSDGSIENRLERFVAGFAIFKTEIVAKHQKFFGTTRDQFDNVGQIGQIVFIDFDQP